MASELWGAAAGLQQLIQTQDSHALTQLQLEEGNVHMEAERQQIQQTQDIMQRQKQMLQNIGTMQAQWGKEKRPDNMDQMTWDIQQRAAHLGQMSEEYARQGFPDQAATFANTASEIQYRQAQTRVEDARLKIQQWEHGLQMMGTITDQQSLDAAIQRFPQETGSPSPIPAGTKYTPQLMDTIRSMGLNSLQMAQKDAAQAEVDQREASAYMDRAHGREFDAMAKWYNEGRPGIGKANGTTAPKNPTTAEIQYISSLADTTYDVQPTNHRAVEQVRKASTEAAEIANGLMREGRANSWTEAMRMAFAQEQAAGGFVGLNQKQPKAGTISGDPLKAPMVRNEKGEDVLNEHAIRPNQWYLLKRKDEKEAVPRLAMLEPNGSLTYWTQAQLNQELRRLQNNGRAGVVTSPTGATTGAGPNFDLSSWANPGAGTEIGPVARLTRQLQIETEQADKLGHNALRDRQIRVLQEALRVAKEDEAQ